MFENVLGQSGADQLIRDIEAGLLAPAMLFSGPPASGKGTAALELGRVLSCEAAAANAGANAGEKAESAFGGLAGRAAWNCSCPACSRHRLLLHPDLLCLGPRPFSAEIAASAGAFLRETGSPAARALFIRAVRKLLARFNPAFWGDAGKGGKSGSQASALANSLEEDLDELDRLAAGPPGTPPAENREPLAKLANGMMKSAFKLESEGMGETIPIGQLRRAAYWCRLAPVGRAKLLLIENAERMQDEARNSLLKLLEEPPPKVALVLTSARPGSLLPTVLSRLRPYRFAARSASAEAEVVRRVFRDPGAVKSPGAGAAAAADAAFGENGIGAYLDSFLPVSGAALEALAAFFAASVAYKAALLSKQRFRALSEETVLLGKYCAPKAEAAGFGRPRAENGAVVSLVLEKAGRFEIRSLFSRFLSRLLEQVSQSLRQAPSPFLPSPGHCELWKKCCSWAESAALTYKLSPAQTLEKLFADLSRGMAEL